MKNILTKFLMRSTMVLALVSSFTSFAQEKVEIRDGIVYLDEKGHSLQEFKSELIKHELSLKNINRAIKCDKHLKYYYGYGFKKVVITTIDGLITTIGVAIMSSDFEGTPPVFIITPAAAYHGYRTIKSFHTQEYWKREKIKALEGAVIDYELRL
jgi:hypothetical protein